MGGLDGSGVIDGGTNRAAVDKSSRGTTQSTTLAANGNGQRGGSGTCVEDTINRESHHEPVPVQDKQPTAVEPGNAELDTIAETEDDHSSNDLTAAEISSPPKQQDQDQDQDDDDEDEDAPEGRQQSTAGAAARDSAEEELGFPPLLPGRLRDFAGGHVATKHGKSGWPHRKKVFLDVFGALRKIGEPLLVRWGDEDHEIVEQSSPDWSVLTPGDAGPARCINVDDITSACRGMESPLMQRRGTPANADRYVCLRGSRRDLDLEADSPEEADELFILFDDMVKYKAVLAEIVRAIVKQDIVIDANGEAFYAADLKEEAPDDGGEQDLADTGGIHSDDEKTGSDAGGSQPGNSRRGGEVGEPD